MERTLAEWLHTHELSKYLETLVSNDTDTIQIFNAKLGEQHPSTLEAQKCINQSNTKQ